MKPAKKSIALIQEAPKVLLVGVDYGEPDFDAKLEELAFLSQTAGFVVVSKITCKRKVPDPALFVGSGKAQEILDVALENQVNEIFFDQALSPIQQRNLERFMGMPVNDRTLLILDIFAQRARSHEGQLQVELARLQYLSTRLVRRWSHLERQRGGVGHRGGPGERQIELDRRMLDEAVKKIRARLKEVKQQRHTQRRQRERNGIYKVALVGYTNAGKSSLFNALVKAKVYVADQLFATLDTTTRQMYLENVQQSISISDTVGFIRDLPHGLVEAFSATLLEAVEADLLLHVVDAGSDRVTEQIANVQSVLREIAADQVPQIVVFNKVDALSPSQQPLQSQDTIEINGIVVPRIWISALYLKGLDLLREAIAQHMSKLGFVSSVSTFE